MKIKHCLILLVLMFTSTVTLGQTSWTGAVSSDWNNAQNWDPPVVPDSSTLVNVILDASNPQTNWPHLQQDTKVFWLECINSEIHFNDHSLSTNYFSAANSNLFGSNGISEIVLYPNSNLNNAISIYGCDFSGDFRFLMMDLQRLDIRKSNFDDLRITQSANGSTTNISDTCLFRENLGFHKSFGTGSVNAGNFQIYSSSIMGDLSVVDSSGWAVAIGEPFNITGSSRPGVKILGKLTIDHSNRSDQTGGTVYLHKVSNLTPGGKVKISRSLFVRMASDSIVVDSIMVERNSGYVWIDSSVLHAPFISIQSNYNSQGTWFYPEARLAGNHFHGDFYLTDSLQEIHEARGFARFGTPMSDSFGSPNHYYGNAYFKGKINLGMKDTSAFHRNLTIEAQDGSIYQKARFVGDEISSVNVGQTPLVYALVDKTNAGSVEVVSPLNISGLMRFDNGLVQTKPGSYLRFLNGSVAEGFGPQSYVDGVVQKEGNQVFEFPVGSEDIFKPFIMTAPANQGNLISVKYFDSPPSTVSDTSARVADLLPLSNCEYWEVQQIGGNSGTGVSLSWDPPCLDNTIYFTDPPDVQVARWDGTIWHNEGNGGYSNGYISSGSAVITNGLFTFASQKRTIGNPEPPQAPTMVVYPNPVSNTLNVVVEDGYKQGVIIDAIGRRISIHQVRPGINSFDIMYLPSGVYFLKLITATQQKVFKWVKVN